MYALKLVDVETGQELVWDIDTVALQLEAAHFLMGLEAAPHMNGQAVDPATITVVAS